MSDTTVRRCGLAAFVLALASVPLAPLNALARMLTESGQSDIESSLASWWAKPTMRVVKPWLLDFSDPDTVYLTYGKFYAVALVGVLACVLAARSRRPLPMSRTERWGWRLTIAGFVTVLAGMIGFYYLWPVDALFGLNLLGMLIGIFASILLGIGLLRGGFRPRLAAWVILLDLPLSIGLVSISTQALGMWPMMLAYGTIGWSLWRGGAVPGFAAGTSAASPVGGRLPSRTP
jgi:hypothetical protein